MKSKKKTKLCLFPFLIYSIAVLAKWIHLLVYIYQIISDENSGGRNVVACGPRADREAERALNALFPIVRQYCHLNKQY